MKILKIVGIILLALITIYLVLCIAGPKRVDVSVTREMDVSPAAAYAQVINLKNWENWGPWMEEDPDIDLSYGEKASGEGASYSWKSEKVGNGSLKVLETTPNESIRNELQFGGFEQVSYGKWQFEPMDGGEKAKVTWGIEDSKDVGFFMRGFLVMMKGQIKGMFEEGLENLETAASAAPAPSALPEGITEIEAHGVKYLGMRQTMQIEDAMEGMSDFFAEAYGKIGAHLGPKMSEVGIPVGLTWTWDEETGTTDMAAAIPLQATPELGEPNETIKTPAGNLHVYDGVAAVDYYGAYEQMDAAYNELFAWLGKQGKEGVMPAVEQYVTDPADQPDTSRWLTRVMVHYK